MADIRKWIGMIIVVMVSGLFYWGSVVAQESQQVQDPLDTMTDFIDRAHYIMNVRPYLDVDAILFPGVEVDSDLDVELVDSTLTDYLKLRIRNNFANYPILNSDGLLDEIFGPLQGDKCSILVKVWTVGTEYPIAYHIEMKCFIWNWPIASIDIDAHPVHADAILAVISPANAEDSIKKAIDQLVERFAIKFLKAKGEI